MTYVRAEYGVEEEDLRGLSRNRVVCEARAVIAWLSWRLESSSFTDVSSFCFHTLSNKIQKSNR
jgi:chromosomal replication initiation ATPase DnaA